MAGSMRYRIRVGEPGSDSIKRFAAAMTRIQAIRDNRGFGHIAGFHGAPGWFCWHHQFSRRTDDRAQLFLPWHRAYLHRLELALNDGESGDGVALPWWDWTRTRGVPDAYAAARIDGSGNPLRGFRIDLGPPVNIRRTTQRSPGNPLWLPTSTELNASLNESDWSAFSDNLQNLHDRVHGWVGGDMGDVTTAGFDPIFYAHHCMIDRAWYLWQVRHGVNNIPSTLLDFVLDPFSVTVRDVLDTRALGYEYADQVQPLPPANVVVVG
jgi:tyrosinase